jgi:HTH-type transcriptional regulator / antitoxin HigA
MEKHMSELKPAEVFPPGEFLRDELEARAWTQTEFAEIIGRPPRLINEIIAAKRSITPETAQDFAAALGTSAQFWMNLETAYQLSKARPAAEIIVRRAKIHEKFPVREMTKRGWLDESPNIDVLETRLLAFFSLTSIDEAFHLPHAARRNYATELSPVQLAWLFRVRQIAQAISVPKYSERALRDALLRLKDLLSAPEEARHVPRILMECGVRFIIVEALPKGRIDGVCFWLDRNNPVIGMSMQHDRIDNFWFVLRHEIEHILQKHGGEEGKVDTELEGEQAGIGQSMPEEERIANTAAGDFCVPVEKLDSFMKRKHPFYYEKDVIAFARLLRIHPGLVVGQMRNRLRRYDYLTKHLVKIRPYVLPGAIADGWGQTVPVAN